jgi:hypothetical protein
MYFVDKKCAPLAHIFLHSVWIKGASFEKTYIFIHFFDIRYWRKGNKNRVDHLYLFVK